MAATERNWPTVVTELIRLTQKGAIKWNQMDPPPQLISTSDATIVSFFSTELHGRIVGIYEERYRTHSFGETVWDSQIEIAFFTEDWAISWKWPKLEAARDLMEAVRYQAADADSFLDAILKGGGEKNS